MPELPEVETVRRGLVPVMEGRVIASLVQRRENLRIPFPADFADRVSGKAVRRLERRAKYLLLRLYDIPGTSREADEDDDLILVIHLGMSGRMTAFAAGDEPGPAGPHDHVEFLLDDGALVRFNDPRRFGLMTLVAAAELPAHRLFANMGPEPLGNGFSEATLSAALRGRKTPIKAALLDQRVVSGLGNIYVCEALFRAGISPRRMAASVAGKRAERLVPAVRQILREAIEAGGSSLRDYVRTDGTLGYFQHNFGVYDKAGEPCPGCDCDILQTGGIQRLVQSGRSTFFCPRKQK